MKKYILTMVLILFFAVQAWASPFSYKDFKSMIKLDKNFDVDIPMHSVFINSEYLDIKKQHPTSVAPVPEPFTSVLLGTGLLVLGFINRKKL